MKGHKMYDISYDTSCGRVFTSDVPIDISSVCDNLLSSRGLGLEDYLKLMKLLRLLRNSLVHNNGRYILKDDNAGWDSVSIVFRKGQMIQLGESGWKVMFVIGNGIREMLQKVVNSDQIIKKPIIKDPSYASSYAS